MADSEDREGGGQGGWGGGRGRRTLTGNTTVIQRCVEEQTAKRPRQARHLLIST